MLDVLGMKLVWMCTVQTEAGWCVYQWKDADELDLPGRKPRARVFNRGSGTLGGPQSCYRGAFCDRIILLNGQLELWLLWPKTIW